jgi:arsenite methyltransferase
MESVLRAWDDHLSDPLLPRTLSAQLRAAAFENVEMRGHTFATNDVTEESYAGGMLTLMTDYVATRPEIGPEVAAEWAAEQRDLQARGESYFACVQFCFTATRPS